MARHTLAHRRCARRPSRQPRGPPGACNGQAVGDPATLASIPVGVGYRLTHRRAPKQWHAVRVDARPQLDRTPLRPARNDPVAGAGPRGAGRGSAVARSAALGRLPAPRGRGSPLCRAGGFPRVRRPVGGSRGEQVARAARVGSPRPRARPAPPPSGPLGWRRRLRTRSPLELLSACDPRAAASFARSLRELGAPVAGPDEPRCGRWRCIPRNDQPAAPRYASPNAPEGRAPRRERPLATAAPSSAGEGVVTTSEAELGSMQSRAPHASQASIPSMRPPSRPAAPKSVTGPPSRRTPLAVMSVLSSRLFPTPPASMYCP